MRFLALFAIFLAAALTGLRPVSAQQPAALQVNSRDVSYEFGQYIIFQAQLSLSSQPAEAYLVFRADGEEATRVIPIQVDAGGNVSLRYEISQGAVRPFAPVRYSYRVKLPGGQELNSQEFSFAYLDNRFSWQTLTGEDVSVHWYDGDASFGQAALDAAQAGLRDAKKLLPVSQMNPSDVYIYASSADQAPALEVGSQMEAGGHASPDLRVGLVTIPSGPEQKLEMGQKIPHELAHILTYDLLGAHYPLLPVWLREGIAAQVETSSDPDYQRALSEATTQSNLIPMSELCGAFPAEKGQLLLAYAESQAFTRYLIQQYGQTDFLALTQAYGNGLSCSEGMQQALGKPLAEVEAGWRAGALGENAGLNAFYKLFPYLATFVVLLTVSLVSAFANKRSSNG